MYKAGAYLRIRKECLQENHSTDVNIIIMMIVQFIQQNNDQEGNQKRIINFSWPKLNFIHGCIYLYNKGKQLVS